MPLHVAPYTGAWIETKRSIRRMLVIAVAPYTGAWIETPTAQTVLQISAKSHPTRVRGLKRPLAIRSLLASMSHPTRVRGLKLYQSVLA